MQERTDQTCLVTTFPSPEQSLQKHLDNFHHELMSHCTVCNEPQIRITTFHHLPPLLAFEWSGRLAPDLSEAITITTNHEQQTFTLKGIILSKKDWSHKCMV
jgi:hypothetical protein